MILVLVCTAYIGQAQHQHKVRKMSQDFSPEQKAILATKKMTLSYDLSEAQQEKMLALNTKWVNEMEKLKAVRKSENSEEMTSTQRFEHLSAMLDKKIAHQNEIKGVLNKDQFEQWKKNADRRDKKHKSRKGHAEKPGSK